MSEPLPDFDLYELLEVSPTASTQTIEAAWRSLMKRNHPDLRGEDAEERARRLNVAHDWLTDADRRARYDRDRAAALERARAGRWTSPSHTQPAGVQPQPLTAAQPSAAALARWRLAFILALTLMPIGGIGGWTDLLLLGGILAAICALVLIIERH